MRVEGLGLGFWVLGFGFWVLGFGWSLGFKGMQATGSDPVGPLFEGGWPISGRPAGSFGL